MNAEKLRAHAQSKGYSVPKLAAAIGIGKKAMYFKLAGKTEFTQGNISRIAQTLELGDDEIIAVFFERKVS
ncbi:MAG: helix-turn-helix transcriptional regulator [Clostridia bacterium]|nr:helix-turn-helix transcriptional regulator [Clostridia bacterium]